MDVLLDCCRNQNVAGFFYKACRIACLDNCFSSVVVEANKRAMFMKVRLSTFYVESIFVMDGRVSLYNCRYDAAVFLDGFCRVKSYLAEALDNKSFASDPPRFK